MVDMKPEEAYSYSQAVLPDVNTALRASHPLTDGIPSVVQLLKINFLAMFNKCKIFLSFFPPEMFSFQPQV